MYNIINTQMYDIMLYISKFLFTFVEFLLRIWNKNLSH